MGPKGDCLLTSLPLDLFCDTTSTLFTPNLTVEDREDGSLHDFRAQGQCSTVICCKSRRKQLLYRYLRSVQSVIVELRECSIRVCSFREPE